LYTYRGGIERALFALIFGAFAAKSLKNCEIYRVHNKNSDDMYEDHAGFHSSGG